MAIFLILYVLFFSVVTSVICLPAWIVGYKKNLLTLKDFLLIIYGYFLSLFLVVFSFTAQSFRSFFMELFFISSVYVLIIYLRVFLLKYTRNRQLAFWLSLILFLGLLIISFIMPVLPE